MPDQTTMRPGAHLFNSKFSKFGYSRTFDDTLHYLSNPILHTGEP